MKPELTLGIVGATGIVGQTALDLLAEDLFAFRIKKIKLYASHSSVGKTSYFNNHAVQIEETKFESLKECNAVLFASDAAVSREFIPKLCEIGVLCVDKSSAFRSDSRVPLVVPEVNGELLSPHTLKSFPLVASPNCCTIPFVMVLKALSHAYGVQRAVISTYQSVSGAGKAGLDILTEETKQFLTAQDPAIKPSTLFPKPIGFNVMPFVASILENGDTDEESKIIFETQKVLNMPNLPLSATSVRVPTFVGHAEAVTLQLGTKADAKQICHTLNSFPGIQANENVNEFVTPRESHGKDPVFVSRIRPAQVFENGISLWIVSDNLRKGAALNALQIIDLCLKNKVI